jgi:uncharacterized membrane protein
MDAVHIHLIVNHVPVIVTILSVLLISWAIYSGKAEYRKIAFFGLIIAALFALVAFQSGENAEDIVENLDWFDHDVLENHEHAAETARWFVILAGLTGIAGLSYFKDAGKKGFRLFLWVTLILSVISAGYLIYTGYLGGMIRHTELTMLGSL